MDSRIAVFFSFSVGIVCFAILHKTDGDDSRLLQHRSGSHYFIRLNSKLSIFDYTTIFEYAAGYRLNYDVKPFDEVRSLDEGRRRFHRSIESELHRQGLDGQACLYRMFCEIESVHGQNDIVSLILKFLFRSQNAYTCPETPACSLPLAWIPYVLYHKTADGPEGAGGF